ncbi:hypothetical protein Tco_1260744 [Tanacetum coccineum]
MKSSSVSFDFTNKLLNFENVSPADNEIAFLMDTTIPHEEPSNSMIESPTWKEICQNEVKEALANRREYIDLIDTSVRVIIKEEVKTKLPQILPQAVSEFATPVIERNVTESLEAAILAKYSSQIKSTYEAAASLSEFELTKILMDKIEEHKSYLRADYKRELYDALVKSYNTDKDLFDTYGTSRSQHKSSGKSAHAEEPSHIVDDSRVQHNQEFDTGNNDEQPDDEAASKNNWYKKPEQPPTPDPDWDKRQHVDF